MRAALRPAVLERIAGLLGEATGMVFEAAAVTHLEHAVARAMGRAHATDDASYAAALETEPRILAALIDEVSVGETYFFRHHQQFEFVEREILPELAKGSGPIRCWSAGCSSGEEAWSLAMLLREAGLLERSRVIGTDVSPAALARARAGRYRGWSLRGEAGRRPLPHLRREGLDFVVRDELRAHVAFAPGNLAAPEGEEELTEPVSLVLCRNVLIYLDRPSVTRAARRVLRTLAPGGWLVAGPSDPLLSRHAPFDVAVTDAGVYYRRPSGERVVPVQPAPVVPAGPSPLPAALAPPAPGRPPPLPGAPAGPIAAPVPAWVAVPEGPLAAARQALEAGDVAAALEILGTPEAAAEPAAARLRIRLLANRDAAAALEAARDEVERHPADVEGHHLLAVLLLEARRDAEAAVALRRLVYLEPTAAIAHFLLGEAQLRLGEGAAARRSFLAAARLAGGMARGASVPFTDGEPAGRLAEAAAAAADRAGGGA